MKYLSESYVIFSLSEGEFDPAEFTKIIGIQPTETNVKGELGEYGVWKHTSWGYKSETTDVMGGLDNAIEKLVETFESKIDIINQYKADNNLESICCIVILQKKKENLGVRIPNAFMRFLNATDTYMEICVYT